MAVAIYVRVSTEEQRERQSINTQRDFATRYCALHELAIHETYADDGVSGTVPLHLRPGGVKLLQDARNGKFSQLLIFKLDRLGRETRLILDAEAELRKLNVRVRSMTEEFDTGSPTGQLMLTMLSGFATHEREVIRERSVLGTNRLAEAGAWLGGIVPYGYLKQGERGQSRLVVCDEPSAGLKQSEAEVVRTIYRLCAKEKKSCQRIADHLNRTAVPCGSAVNAGKRNARTATIWRPSHVRNMIVSTTYMGTHHYGKRSVDKNRKPISRSVPAIVSEETWNAAQLVLRSNLIMSKRNCAQPYLLRGLIKCGLCGLTYSGIRIGEQKDHYYRCNGRQFARGRFGLSGKKCPSKNLNGEYVERLVWADIEAFLRDPGEVLEKLRQRMSLQDGERAQRQTELDAFISRLADKTAERERVLGLFRRGRIGDAELDTQLDLIDAEAAGLQAEIEAASRFLSTEDQATQFRNAESLLALLRKRLEQPISPDLKRQIVEALVESVVANTVERWGVAQSEITIVYRFGEPTVAAILVLPRSHRLEMRKRPPEELNTLADHLLRRRLVLKLLQREVAERLGVSNATIVNWESGRTKPEHNYMPAIICFLGYNPLPPSKTWAGRLVGSRTALGLSQKRAAKQMGVDASTLARWEHGEREPLGSYLVRATGFVGLVESASFGVMSKIA